MQGTVRLTVVSEVEVKCSDPGEFHAQIIKLQKMVLPDPHTPGSPAKASLVLKGADFEWKDAEAVVASIEVKIGK